MLKGVHHIALRPSPEKFAETERFYREVLGMKLVRGWGEGDNCVVMLSCGDNTVMEIIATPNQGIADGAVDAIDHIALATELVDEMTEKVRKAGYEITVEPKDVELENNYNIRISFFKGPIGELVEFFHEK